MVISLFITILTSIIFSVPQQDYKLTKELAVQADYFTVGPLGFIYCVRGSSIQKVNLKSNHSIEYSNPTLGNIGSVDASDPFRTLVFYKDFNRIEFLDRNLTLLTSAIQLDNLGYYNVAAVCTSVNGGFWLFDQTLNQLVYINQDLKPVKKSAKLTEMLDQNGDQEQVFMLEKNDYIYLGIETEGILLFDYYGTYIKTFPIKNMSSFQVNNETITYLKNGNQHFYNTSNYNEDTLNLPKEPIKQVVLENNRLFILSEKKISIYQLNNL
jgi:hypothetical protein